MTEHGTQRTDRETAAGRKQLPVAMTSHGRHNNVRQQLMRNVEVLEWEPLLSSIKW